MCNIRSISPLLVLAAFIFAGTTSLFAQSAFDSTFNNEAGRVKEHLEVFTDRSIYVINERIRFRADHRVEGLEGEMPWSTILYAELVSASGQVLKGSKYPLVEGVGRGSLAIPSDVLTGHYYLRCYTRWMRNQGPASFSYLPIRIINPFKTEVAAYPNGNNGIVRFDSTRYMRGLLGIENPTVESGRDGEVSFHLSLPSTGYPESLSCCVTIVPVGAIDTLNGIITQAESGSGTPEFSINYLPEIDGISLSGRVVHPDGTPAPFTRVHFSMLGEDQDFFTTITDGHGRFVISTPDRAGDRELFVVPESPGENRVEVRIDQDFDQGKLRLPEQEFRLSDLEREVATQLAIRMQLARIFKERQGEEPLITDSIKEVAIPFYGTPAFRLEMHEYVNLPSLEEVFINLVPDVFVLKKRGRKLFKINSDNSAIGIFPTLIMIDYIPVFDQEAVMALEPEKIRRIEVINEVYVKGDISFGGVISIFSLKGDMAGIDLAPGSYFFDFQSLEPVTLERPGQPEPGDRIPDTRNTLLWLDDVSVEQGSSVEFRCKAPDQPGDYLVFVRGVTKQGRVHSATARFRISGLF